MQATGFASTHSKMYSTSYKQLSNRFENDEPQIESGTNSFQLILPTVQSEQLNTPPPLDVGFTVPEELLWLQLGEEIPTVDKQDFDITTIIEEHIKDKDQLKINKYKEKEEIPQVINQQAKEEHNNYNSISDLLRDEQMFRLDQDLKVFDINSEDFTSSLELGDKDFNYTLLSDDYIPPNEDIEMFNELLFGDELVDKRKEEEELTPTVSPLPTLPPLNIPITTSTTTTPAMPQQEPQQEAPTVKMEEDEFDLVTFIDSNEFSVLTPFEEKSCPNFEVKKEEEKQEPECSVSNVPSPKTSVSAATVVTDHQYESLLRPKRIVKKRRYSTDSDYSIGTSASSYNSTRQKIHKRKRGRPAKELITKLPTLEDFKDLPQDRASFLVLRIKNNEASRKSRMKSKSMQEALEDQCTKLMKRQNLLKDKRNKLDGQIETLRKWLLGGV